MDDGINAPVEASVIVDVSSSAPVLNLDSPDLTQGYHSSDLIEFDLRNSIDYDGDNFTFNLTSDISGTILTDSNPLEIHSIYLDAGLHSLTFTLTDDTGLSRQETISLQIVESDPQAVIYEPMNNQFYEPGELIILDSNGTNDADNDITRREWRLHVPGELYPVVMSNSEFYTTNLLPGVHHISLFVEDRRGGVDESHINITVASSSPDLSNLTASPKFILVDELTKISVSVALDDPDGTTSQINATITKNLQVWKFNLTDDNNDGIWVGQIEIIAQESGKAQLKVTAIDGETIDFMTMDLDFVEEETDNTSLYIVAGGIASFLLVASLLAWLVIRRRKRLSDLDLIDSWGVFGGESKEYDQEELEN